MPLSIIQFSLKEVSKSKFVLLIPYEYKVGFTYPNLSF